MKKKNKVLYFLVASVLFLALPGCDFFEFNKEEETADYTYMNSAWVIDELSEFPLVGFHEDGSVVAFQTEPSNGTFGAVYQKNLDAPAFYVQADSKGYPVKAFFDGAVFLFENYENNKVDVATILPNGDIEIERGVEFYLPDSDYSGNLKSSQFNPEQFTLGDALHYGSIALSVGLCVGSIITAPAHLGIGTYLACGAAITNVGLEFVPDDWELVKNSGKAATYIASGAGCYASDVGSCVSLVVSAADDIVNYYEDKSEENASQIQLAQGGLTSPIEDVPSDVNEFINEDLLNELTDKGFPIHTGYDPPFVEGFYYTNALKNWETSSSYIDYTFKFANQTSLLEIDLEYVSETGTSTAISNEAYVSGGKNNFSLFAEIKSEHNHDSHVVKLTTAAIISGSYSINGIEDFMLGFLVTSKSNDLYGNYMEVGQSRIVYESDLLAESVSSYPYNAMKSAKVTDVLEGFLLVE